MTYPYINHVKATLFLMSKSYNELEILFRERGTEEIKLVQSTMIKNYVLSLHYMFFNELCKLIEVPGSRQGQNVASLEAWNRFQFMHYREGYSQVCEENQRAIEGIRTSKIFETVKTYRDKKFSHIDESADPLKFSALNKCEMTLLRETITEIKKIVKNCTGADEYEFYFDRADNRTNNFIRRYTHYSLFYRKNLSLALEQGFYLNRSAN